MIPVAILVIAKAPVPGFAKTRLARELGEHQAATFAAAALLDTLDIVTAVPAAFRIVALTGDFDAAVQRAALFAKLQSFTIIEQSGNGLAERLVHAHTTVGESTGAPILQIGMDTPQVSAALLEDGARTLTEPDRPCLLGPAEDGGWWALGLSDHVFAQSLLSVPMSDPDTGRATHAALTTAGAHVRTIPTLRDFDFASDLGTVAAACPPGSRFRTMYDTYRSEISGVQH